MELFRKEVLERASASWLGPIHLASSISRTTVTLASVTLAVMLLAFLGFAQVSRKVRLQGVIAPVNGVLNIAANQSATIAEIFVQEGQAVHVGQPLVRLKISRTLKLGDRQKLDFEALEARKATLMREVSLQKRETSLRQDSIAERAKSQATELRHAEAELDTLLEREAIARKFLQKSQELAASGFISDNQLQLKFDELLDLQTKAHQARRSIQSLKREIESSRAERVLSQTELSRTEVQLQRQLSSLDQELNSAESQSEWVISAPTAGHVTLVNQHAGQTVAEGQSILAVVPDSGAAAGQAVRGLQVELWAPSRAAGFIQPDQKVWLRYSAFPYEKFGMASGHIKSISDTPIVYLDGNQQSAAAAQSISRSGEPLYRVIVELERQSVSAYGRERPLKAGMTLEADVKLDYRRLWEWFFEPLIASATLASK